MYRHILVAVDGSTLGFTAFDHAAKLARISGATLTVVTVCERPAGYADSDYGWSVPEDAYMIVHDAQSSAAQRVLQSAATRESAAGLSVDTRVVDALTAYEGILEASREHHADLIIMGSHGRRGIERLLLGSVAARVLSLSPIPVLVVKVAQNAAAA